MNRLLLSMIVFCFIFILTGTVRADEELLNPSVYSAGEMVQDLPKFWGKSSTEVQDYLKKYPDHQCEYYPMKIETGIYDQIVCKSVNNPRSSDITINFFIAGDFGTIAGLQTVVYTIGTPQTQDVQTVFENLWLPDARPAHTEKDEFYDLLTSIIYYTDNTLIRYNLPDFQTMGLDYMTVEIWEIESRDRVRG